MDKDGAYNLHVHYRIHIIIFLLSKPGYVDSVAFTDHFPGFDIDISDE